MAAAASVKPSRAPRVMAGLAALAAIGWLAGFGWFAYMTRRLPDTLPPHTDGIVALTGGAGRVDLALRLLESGRADHLLLSGIGGRTDLATLGRIAGVDTAGLADRVTLGRYAASTRGNGLETAAWAEQNRIRSLIVVTAAYHMPRALVELHLAMPAVTMYPHPVGSGDVGMRLEAEEYSKYLLSVSGLSGWLPPREQPAGVGS